MRAPYSYSRRPSDEAQRSCRSPSCDFPRAGALGFCVYCDAVYRAALALRARRIEACAARLRAAHPDLFGAMTPRRAAEPCWRTSRRTASTSATGDGRLELRGLEDFFAEAGES